MRPAMKDTCQEARLAPRKNPRSICSPHKVSTRQFERDLDELQASFAKAVKSKLEKFLHNRRLESSLQSVRQQYRYRRVERAREKPSQHPASPPVASDRTQLTLPGLTVINFGRRYDAYSNHLLQKAAMRRKLNSSVDTQTGGWHAELYFHRPCNRSDMGVYPMLVSEGNQTGEVVSEPTRFIGKMTL